MTATIHILADHRRARRDAEPIYVVLPLAWPTDLWALWWALNAAWWRGEL